jgi:hypothetical protein
VGLRPATFSSPCLKPGVCGPPRRIWNSNGLLAPPPQEPPSTPAGGLPRPAWLGLDRCLRLGEESASGVPWGDGLGTGDVGRLEAGAFAELERNLIWERMLAGLASARQRGRCGGRPRAIDAEAFAMALQLYEAQHSSVQSICAHLGIARRTFYRYVAAHRTRLPCPQA